MPGTQRTYSYSVWAGDWRFDEHVWRLTYPYLTLPGGSRTAIERCTVGNECVRMHVCDNDRLGRKAYTVVSIELPHTALWADTDYGMGCERMPGMIVLKSQNHTAYSAVRLDLYRAARAGDLARVRRNVSSLYWLCPTRYVVQLLLSHAGLPLAVSSRIAQLAVPGSWCQEACASAVSYAHDKEEVLRELLQHERTPAAIRRALGATFVSQPVQGSVEVQGTHDRRVYAPRMLVRAARAAGIDVAAEADLRLMIGETPAHPTFLSP